MAFELSLFFSPLIEKHAVNAIIKCNEMTVNFGLTLTESQALALVETRSLSLRENGRVEFGGGVIDKIIFEFCDSPYLTMCNYEETLHDLLEVFYFYKNETLDLISDNDLIKYMKNAFGGICQGSLELLSGRELYKLARDLRYGYEVDFSEDTSEKEGSEDEEDEFYED